MLQIMSKTSSLTSSKLFDAPVFDMRIIVNKIIQPITTTKSNIFQSPPLRNLDKPTNLTRQKKSVRINKLIRHSATINIGDSSI